MNIRSLLESNLLATPEPVMPHEVSEAKVIFKRDVKHADFRHRVIGYKKPVLWTTQAVHELIRQMDEERNLRQWADEVRARNPESQS